MEESDSGTSRSRKLSLPNNQFMFIDLVFSWSTRDIFNENLYKNQVEKIPESFESVDHYFGSYTYPLLEETRAGLASAMETAYKAPFAKITTFPGFRLLGNGYSYNVKVDHWRNRQSDRGKEAYRTLPGDVVLVSNMKPETASDVECAGWNFTFACVIEISDDGTVDDCDFKIRTSEIIEVGDRKGETTLYVVFLMNVTTNKRIWDALEMRENMRIIEKVMSKDDLGDENCALCPLRHNSNIEEQIEQTLTSKLNESQLEAILASLSKIYCYHKPSVELIWGPPGTGKTTTLSILLYTLLRMNVRTLICAPTNVAITELASRVLSLVRNSVKTESDKTSFPSCSLGEILIFGNKDRLKFGSDMEEIYLDYRIDSLQECFSSFTGWKHCVSSMQDFLNNCVSHYQIFVENEKMHVDSEKSESKSLLEFC